MARQYLKAGDCIKTISGHEYWIVKAQNYNNRSLKYLVYRVKYNGEWGRHYTQSVDDFKISRWSSGFKIFDHHNNIIAER